MSLNGQLTETKFSYEIEPAVTIKLFIFGEFNDDVSQVCRALSHNHRSVCFYTEFR